MERFTVIDWDNLAMWGTSELGDVDSGGSTKASTLEELVELIQERITGELMIKQQAMNE